MGSGFIQESCFKVLQLTTMVEEFAKNFLSAGFLLDFFLELRQFDQDSGTVGTPNAGKLSEESSSISEPEV